MNEQAARDRTVWAYIAGIVGSFLVLAGLAWAIHYYMQPPPLGEDRAAVRAKALAELRAADTEALEHPGWVDPTKGIVRLPIAEAMKLVEQQWGRDPATGRSNLIARVEKATAVAPKPPEKPSPYE